MNKKLIPLLFIIAALFQACSGSDGRDGAPGLDGVNIVGQTFEVENVDFNTANNFRYVQTYASAKLIDVRESDAVLIYVLWEVVDQDPIWRLLPQAIDMPRGVTYNFDYSPADFSVFIDAPTAALKASLSADFTQNQTFRIVVIPSDFTDARKNTAGLDYNNYNAVKEYFNLDESKIPKYNAEITQ